MAKIDLVLVGKTGHGKSSTGNTILQDQLFQEGVDVTDCTELLALKKRRLSDNTELRVYDTPGLMSLNLSPAKIVKQMDHLMDAAEKINIFCFVFNFNNRFTKEEADTVKQLKAMFGVDFLRNNGIIVVTHGDNCETEAGKLEISSKEMFKRCCDSSGADFTQLISEVRGNILLVNNKGDFSESSPRSESAYALRQMITKVSQQNRPFTKGEYYNLKQNATGSSCVII